MKKQHIIDICNLIQIYHKEIDNDEKQSILSKISNYKETVVELYNYDNDDLDIVDDVASSLAYHRSEVIGSDGFFNALQELGIAVENNELTPKFFK